MILTAIYEQDFLDCSYGYRPDKGAKDAVSDLVFQLQFGVFGYIVEADVKAYFDSIDHARLFYDVLPKRLGRYGLQVEPSKTKIIRFSRFQPSRKRGRTFTFLGFEFYWFKDRKGIPRAMRRTAPSKQRAALQRMKAWLKASRHLPKKQFFKTLKRKLIGHYNYYYVRGNSRA